jgi:hypothetical protein
VLEPYFAGDPAGGFAHVSAPDADAEVYGLGGNGPMITHASGEFIWQVMVDVAVARYYVIMPSAAPCAL